MINQRLNSEITDTKADIELIFNTSPDASMISRADDGIIVNINEGFTAVSGFTRNETLGKSALDLHIWKNLADREKFLNELREKGFCENFEAVLQRKDGSQTVGILSAKIITLQGLPHVISTIRNITERKQAEEALHRSETKFRTLYDSTSDAVMLLDEKGFFDCNQAALAIFGCATREEFCSKHPADLSPPSSLAARIP